MILGSDRLLQEQFLENGISLSSLLLGIFQDEMTVGRNSAEFLSEFSTLKSE